MGIISTIKHIINGVDIDSLNNTITILKSALKSVRDDNAQKTTEITRLKHEINTLNKELVREGNKCLLAEKRQKELTANISKLEEKLTAQVPKNDIILESQKSLSKENASLKVKIARRENKIKNLLNEKNQQAEAITKLQKESVLLVQKNEALNMAFKKIEDINTQNTTELRRLKTEIEKEQTKSKYAHQELEKIKILYSDFQKNTLEEKNVLLNRISESDKRCNNLKEDNATLLKTKLSQINIISSIESEKKNLNERIFN